MDKEDAFLNLRINTLRWIDDRLKYLREEQANETRTKSHDEEDEQDTEDEFGRINE